MTDDEVPFTKVQMLAAIQAYQRAFIDMSVSATAMSQFASRQPMDLVALQFLGDVLDSLDRGNREVKKALDT
ncbi:hypothetical protein AWB73_01983 [Caballeronia turbans]|jgi:hypothetical protein|uniref:hypothetical protein n=1 Tax=Caballeronia sp. INSB1 TaxID=2921751 RepID=UPI00074CE986|nr:hypothetical protein [Caballeronia sp. INSB1]SAL26096.1 hypothetical protein AWB73_01983 [Caballeronia turbans]